MAFRFQSILAAATLALAACGGPDTATATGPVRDEDMECTLSLPADSTDQQIQQAIDDVLAGRVQACGRATSSTPTVVRIDRGDALGRVDLVFHFGRYQVR